jgi:hypothetical protein
VTAPKAIAARPDPAGAIQSAGLAAYLRQIIARARALPEDALTTRRFRIAGQSILARFSDHPRANLYASRLPDVRSCVARPEPEFCVDVIETTRLGWQAPARWCDPSCVREDFDRTLESAGLRALPPFRPQLWEFMDRERNWAFQLMETPLDLPVWEAGAPLRIPLHWASLDRGRRLVHGATLGNDGAAILIAGPGRTGKSAMTLTGIAHGLKTVGDDYVVIEPGTPPAAWQAFRLLKQDRAGIARLPGLAARIGDSPPNWQGKLELDPEALFPGCMAATQPIRAILVPQINAATETRIEPIERKFAFDALARSTLQQFPSERVSGFLFCTGLIKSLPCFSVALSQAPDEIAAALKRFIEGLAT